MKERGIGVCGVLSEVEEPSPNLLRVSAALSTFPFMPLRTAALRLASGNPIFLKVSSLVSADVESTVFPRDRLVKESDTDGRRLDRLRVDETERRPKPNFFGLGGRGGGSSPPSSEMVAGFGI